MVRLAHASGEAVTVACGQALGSDSPLVFDEDGHAEVDDADAAELVAAMYRDIRVEPAADTAASDGFDADAFVDRTPMEAVIDDLETGEYDEYLDAIEAAADREGVQEAIDDRRE